MRIPQTAVSADSAACGREEQVGVARRNVSPVALMGGAGEGRQGDLQGWESCPT